MPTERRVSNEDLKTFARHFAEALDGTKSLPQYLAIVAKKQTNSQLRRALVELHNAITEGELLTMAMAKHPDVFPQDFIAMVDYGEETGTVDLVLRDYADDKWQKGRGPSPS